MTKVFSIAINWGFWLSFLMFTRAILAQIALHFKIWILLWVSYVLFAINVSQALMLFVFMNIWRWSHSGRVCSGDFLPDRQSADTSVYLIKEGMFIKIILLGIYLIILLAMFTVCCTACILMRRQAREEAE